MTRRLTPEKQLELDMLARRLGVIAAFVDGLMAGAMPNETVASAVAEAYTERNLRGLSMLQSELLAMTQAMTTVQRRDLDAQLRDVARVSLLSLLDRQCHSVSRLRARGKLTSEQQYYLVRQHIELLVDDPAHADELGELQALLEEFELRSAKRSRASIAADRSNDR